MPNYCDYWQVLNGRERQGAAERRTLVDLALIQVMRDGLFRRSEAAALRWGDVDVH